MSIELSMGGVLIGRVVSYPRTCFAYDPAGNAVGTYHDVEAAARGLARLAGIVGHAA